MLKSSMLLADLNGKLVILLGFGREGKAMYEVLKSKVSGARIIVTDEKKIDVPEYHELADAIAAVTPDTVVIKSPGIPWHRSYVEEMQTAGAHCTSSTNLFMAERRGQGTIIGVTGTKGKSTTSSLLAHVLKEAGKRVVLAGNIGEPAIAHIGEPADTIFVLEMSSYQLSDLVVAPNIAVLLNLYEEHMDYHGDVASYHAAKMRIADLQTGDDVFVYNEKFPQLVELADRVKSKAIPFVSRSDRSLNTLKLSGDHNRENAAGILAVTDHLGIDRKIVERAFSTFVPLPHRLQDIGVHHGIRWINDSISTTPQSALAAIAVFEKELGAIILGGQDRGYHFADLAKRIVSLGVTAYILPGGEAIAEAIRHEGGVPMMKETLAEIVRDVVARFSLDTRHPTLDTPVCLLSPASPSYGQFKNFEDRGEQFIAAVRKE
jgi:UDP-N-acetylmuramoyl-L-alanine---L-glutamate ligase